MPVVISLFSNDVNQSAASIPNVQVWIPRQKGPPTGRDASLLKVFTKGGYTTPSNYDELDH